MVPEKVQDQKVTKPQGRENLLEGHQKRIEGLIYPTSSSIPAIDEDDALEMIAGAAAPRLNNNLGV